MRIKRPKLGGGARLSMPKAKFGNVRSKGSIAKVPAMKAPKLGGGGGGGRKSKRFGM
jgi:hypothetical protein